MPYIEHHSFVKSIFPEENPNILWLHANHTFPLFCELLVLPEYTESILIGLIASIGQLTESLVSDFIAERMSENFVIDNLFVAIISDQILIECNVPSVA